MRSMSSYAPSPNILRRTSGPVRWSPWGSLNSAEGSPLSTGLQNRACQFPSTRLLSDIALGMSTLFRGSIPMYLIMADEVEEFQVVKPVILARLLLDSRGVDLPMSYDPIVVTLSS